MIALWSGLMSYRPAQPPRMPAVAIRGARRSAISSSAGIQSSVVSMAKAGGLVGVHMPNSRPGPSPW